MSRWRSVALGDIFDIARGGSPRPIERYVTNDADGVNWIMIGDASERSRYITSTKKRIRKDGVKSSRLVNPGDFLLTNSMSFGRPYIMATSGCIHDGWLVLSPKEDIDQNFLFHLLGSAPVYSEFARRAAGATVKNLNIELVRGVTVALPPLAEQKRIAAILDAAEALREKRRQAISLSETLCSSVFAEMFGSNDELFHRWTTSPLGDLLSFLTSGSRGWATHYSDSGDLFLRIENVGRDRLLLDSATYVRPPKTAEARRTLTRPNDVLLTITADLGRTAVIPKGVGTAYINQHLAILRTEAIDPRFLSAFIASPAGQKQVLGKNRQAVKAGLNFDDIRSLIIPVPPPDLQQHYRRFANALDRQSIINAAAMVKAKHLTQSLQLRAFRGEL